jgi:hypothetical protein
MLGRRAQLLIPALLVLPSLAVLRGGWAVATLDTVPLSATAGQPLEVAFAMRGHGQALGSIPSSVWASNGKRQLVVPARPTAQVGRYEASLTLPDAGSWTIAVGTDYPGMRTRLLPIEAYEAGVKPGAMSAEEIGLRLFVGKGCATCHNHVVAAARIASQDQSLMSGFTIPNIGPDLTSARFEKTYLERFLADPSIKPSTVQWKMPQLALTQSEIASLVAFVNAERKVTSR